MRQSSWGPNCCPRASAKSPRDVSLHLRVCLSDGKSIPLKRSRPPSTLSFRNAFLDELPPSLGAVIPSLSLVFQSLLLFLSSFFFLVSTPLYSSCLVISSLAMFFAASVLIFYSPLTPSVFIYPWILPDEELVRWMLKRLFAKIYMEEERLAFVVKKLNKKKNVRLLLADQPNKTGEKKKHTKQKKPSLASCKVFDLCFGYPSLLLPSPLPWSLLSPSDNDATDCLSSSLSFASLYQTHTQLHTHTHSATVTYK